jgi:hypothetical protein
MPGAVPIPRKPPTPRSVLRLPRGAAFASAQEREQALSLIWRLATAAGIPAAALAHGAVTLTPLAGGRSEARVFKLTPRTGRSGAAPCRPIVVKIAGRRQGETEKTNYDELVRHGVPAACRPELLGYARTRAHAGLCFAFVGAEHETGVATLTRWLQRGDAAKLDIVLHHLLSRLRRTWYRRAELRAERDIARRYRERYFPQPRALAQTEAALLACATRYFHARRDGARCVIGALSFPLPRAALFASGHKRPYHSCILHGDLNSDNILVGHDPPAVTVVDFQKTGRGHVHEDLLHLEASVRINFPRDAAMPEIFDKERHIALGRAPRGDPYCAAIHQVRDTAQRYFGHIEDEANYPFAVAAIGLRLMQAADLSHTARARITASTLWAAKVLAGET